MHLQAGEVLNNRYRIVKLLGQGGFGAVYRAWDMNMECPRAVKENLDTSPEAQKQFKLEAKILGRLTHQNLPNVIDHFIIPGQGQYLVMDFIDGEDLQEMLDKQGGPLPESQVLPWIEQVCDALTYLHSQIPPIIHRDVKPANIKITPDGNAILVDFGIAKVFDPQLSTTIGARAITPGYSPPEQYGQGSTDVRSDVYSLGATLYSLLTGKTPPDSVDMITKKQPMPSQVSVINPKVSPAVDVAITHAMDLDFDQRIQTMDEFKTALAGQHSVNSTLTLTQPAVTRSAKLQPGTTQQVSVQPSSFTLKSYKKSFPWVAILVILAVVIGSMWPDSGSDTFEGTQTALSAEETQTALAIAALPTTTHTISDTSPPIPTEASVPTLIPTETPAPPATPTIPYPPNCIEIGQTWTSPIDGMTLVCVPTGEFKMGSEDGSDDEKPVHTVYLDSVWMYQTEVTYAQFQQFMTAENYEAEPCGAGKNYPAACVSWYDAQAYCQWAGRRLPTEAEWEKAARGGLEGKKYPWGDDDPVCIPGAQNGAQYDSCTGQTIPVKTFAANGYGLYDMAGNVWEWVTDWYHPDYYANSLVSNPQGPSSGTKKVLRGSGWDYNDDSLRAAYRSSHGPEFISIRIGFRCAVEP